METIRANVNEIIFQNADNGWTVMDVTCEEGTQLLLDSQQNFTAVGCLPSIHSGETVELTGEWVEHREYGTQFRFSSGFPILPDTLIGIERYLGSGLIKGIGKTTAHNIVEHFGEKTLDILEDQPHRIAEVKRIGVNRAMQIAQSYKEQTGMRATMVALQSLGLTTAQSVKLYKVYQNEAPGIVRANPYTLIEDVPGIGFRTADRIALEMGFGESSPLRLRAGIKYTLEWAKNDGGHTCYPYEKLVQKAARALEADGEVVEQKLDELIISSELLAIEVDGVDMVFLPWLFKQEATAARMLLQLSAPLPFDVSIDLEMELRALERDAGVALDAKQRKAVLTAFTHGVLVITGGPGTGKTTIINFILMLMDKLNFNCELCAPTGRAAKRLGEASHKEARTIHRLLGFDHEHFNRDQDNPVEADVIVVDEMSMVDINLFYALLNAVRPGTRLILAGDADQLPSVGAGNVLGDMIKSDCLPVVRLTEIFRQAKLSRIVTNAHKINKGEMPELTYSDDFCFEQISQPDMILERIVGILKRGKLGDPYREVQVLSPMKKGVLGVKNINTKLQQALNPSSNLKPQRQYGETIFRVGDKVMQIKNNYSQEWTRPTVHGVEDGEGVFNGDMGTILSIGNDTIEVYFDDERTSHYEFGQLEELELAYCITIHKSQGNEFPILLLPLAGGPPMLMTRNLLYTAVTRARNRVVIIGRERAVQDMINNVQERERYTSFSYQLQKLMPLFAR